MTLYKLLIVKCLRGHTHRGFGCVTKHKLPSQLIPVTRPTIVEEIEDMTCEENEEDNVMSIITIANILANAPFDKVLVESVSSNH